MQSNAEHNPRPPIRDLRWHRCTADDPWRADMGKRAIHRDADYIEDDLMECQHCGTSFPTA